jgi:hypothetical protein
MFFRLVAEVAQLVDFTVELGVSEKFTYAVS